jgi:hypothetical protein
MRTLTAMRWGDLSVWTFPPARAGFSASPAMTIAATSAGLANRPAAESSDCDWLFVGC